MATEIVGSNLKAKNGYGQNGYTGASSDQPGQRTCSDFLPDVSVPSGDWQVRDVGKSGIKTTPGMK